MRSLEAQDGAGAGDDGLYHGLANYKRYVDRKESAAGNAYKGLNAKGSQFISICWSNVCESV